VSTISAPPAGLLDATAGPAAHDRMVVAVCVERCGRVALFKRSKQVAHDQGRWHCITGYVEHGVTPEQQALEELSEETGLRAVDLTELRPGPRLTLADGQGQVWLVHTFTAVTTRRRLTMNWEHDSYRWTAPRKVARFDGRVYWLDDVIEGTYGAQVFAG
jgi:8-oxo-dGTP pyrophosphatase MutT (NUDIX family)